MTWQPLLDTDPHLVPLTDRMQRVMRDGTDAGRTPEEILLAREAIAEENERGPRRVLSPEMRRALLWIGTEKPERVWKLVDWGLPIEEAYMLKRYLIGGDTSETIGAAMGVTGACVRYRLKRAIWRLRVVQDLAWDLSLDDVRTALRGVVVRADIALCVALWAERFSQSGAAKRLRDWQGTVRRRIAVVVARLEEPARERKDVARIRGTLLELQRRKLWFVATPQPTPGKSVRMPRVG